MIVSEETKKKPKAQLNNWLYVFGGKLAGVVFNHPEFQDGAEIITTKAIAFDPEGNWIETQNTVYILGVPAWQ